MPELRTVTISAPGFFGVNSQDASIDLPTNFCLEADNAIVDKFGRIGAREGINQFSQTAAANPIRMLYEHVKRNGEKELYYAEGSNFTSVDLDGNITLEYTSSANTSDWQGCSLAGNFFAFQEGEAPVMNDIANTTSTIGWGEIGTKANTTLPSGVTEFGTGSAVFGRIWAARTNLDKQTLYWSDTLQGHKFTGGASGSINLENVFPNGTDEIVHIAGFNGFLVIFCRNCIVIYAGADDPSKMTLSDTIDGVGCIGRDTVQDIGTDLIFCSNQGVLSLNRAIQEKSLPQRDLSKNVRDRFLAEALNEPNPIKTVFSPKNAFYLVALNSIDKVWCFDLRTKLEDGSSRVTTWSGMSPTAFAVTRSQELLHIAEGDYVHKYQNYGDNGSSYRLTYKSNYLNAKAPSLLKILKKANVLVVGGSQDNVTFQYDVNYGTNYATRSKLLPESASSEFNEAEFDEAEFGTGEVINSLQYSLSKSGRVFQFGLDIEVFGELISIQQIDVYFKLGKLV